MRVNHSLYGDFQTFGDVFRGTGGNDPFVSPSQDGEEHRGASGNIACGIHLLNTSKLFSSNYISKSGARKEVR